MSLFVETIHAFKFCFNFIKDGHWNHGCWKVMFIVLHGPQANVKVAKKNSADKS